MESNELAKVYGKEFIFNANGDEGEKSVTLISVTEAASILKTSPQVLKALRDNNEGPVCYFRAWVTQRSPDGGSVIKSYMKPDVLLFAEKCKEAGITLPMRPRDAAGVIGISTDELRELQKAGQIKATVIYDAVHFRNEDIEAYLEKETSPGGDIPSEDKNADAQDPSNFYGARFISATALAKKMGVTPQAIYDRVHAGRMPKVVYINGQMHFNERDCVSLLPKKRRFSRVGHRNYYTLTELEFIANIDTRKSSEWGGMINTPIPYGRGKAGAYEFKHSDVIKYLKRRPDNAQRFFTTEQMELLIRTKNVWLWAKNNNIRYSKVGNACVYNAKSVLDALTKDATIVGDLLSFE